MDFNSNILPWLGRTSKMLDYFITDYMLEKGVEVTKTQMILLYRLKQLNGSTQNNLAYITNRNRASLTRLITTMEKKNLVARIPSDKDGRINHIFITKHGEEVLKHMMPLMEELMNVVQQGLSKQEIHSLISVLKKVNNNINAEQFVAFQTNE